MRVPTLLSGIIALFVATCPVAARTFNIQPDGMGDAPTIAAGIDSAAYGDTVLVGCGVYEETDIAMKSGVKLLGSTGDPSCVVIDGAASGRLFSIVSCDSTTEIAGITFRDGYAMAGDGGAVYLGGYMNPAHPLFRGCRFEENRAYARGGAVFVYDQCRPRFIGCVFNENDCTDVGGAVATGANADPWFEDCVFTGNHSTQNGGAVNIGDASSTFRRCDFQGNVADHMGGALAMNGFGGAAVDTCLFAGNSAENAGGALFCGNYSYGSLHGCTIVGNSAPLGSGIAFGNASGFADRVIIAFNQEGAAVYEQLPGDSVTFTCSDIFGNPGGDWIGDNAVQLGQNGNLFADPLFCGDANTGDSLTLRSDSPCAEANNLECGLVGARPQGCIPTREWVGWGDGESWEDPYNWSPTGLPDSIDAVLIKPDDPDTVIFTGGGPVHSLDLGWEVAAVLLRIDADTLTLLQGGRNDLGALHVASGAAMEIPFGATFDNLDGGEIVLAGGDIAGEGIVVNGGEIRKDEGRRGSRSISAVRCGVENRHDDPGDGAIRVWDGVLNFQGEFVNAGSLLVDEGAEALLDPGDGMLRSPYYVNTGFVTILNEGVLRIGGGRVFRNDPGGDVRLEGSSLAGEGTFLNGGVVRCVEHYRDARAINSISCGFENAREDPGDGAIVLESGITSIEGEFANAGSLLVNTGAEALLDPGDGMLRAESFLNEGWVVVDIGAVFTIADFATVFWNRNGGVFDLRGGDLGGEGLFRNAGQLKKTGASPFTDRSFSYLGCRCENQRHDDPGDGAIRVEEGTLAVTGETDNEGEIHVEEGAGLTVGDAGGKAAGDRSGGLVNGGEVFVEGGASFDLYAVLENEPTADFRLAGVATVRNGAEWRNTGSLVVEEAGVLTLEAGRSTSPGLFDNGGLLWIPADGSVVNEGSFLHQENAVLGGAGTFDNTAGSFSNDGVLRPGAPIGDFRFLGDFSMSPLSEVNIDIGGISPGTTYDRLLVTGSIDFGGAVQVRLSGYIPSPGDDFQVIQGSGGPLRDGFVACYGGLIVPGGLYLQPVQETNALSFTTTGSPPPNGAPDAANDLYETVLHEPIVLSLLANDIDPDADPLRILLLGTEGTAGIARIDAGDSTVTYTPPPDFAGADAFTYLVSDCEGGSDSATVTILVDHTSHAIRVPGDAATIAEGLAAAEYGDTVLVESGVYREHDLAMKSGVKLFGVERAGAKVRIDAEGTGRVLLCEEADDATRIEGIVFRNGSAAMGAGVLCVNASPVFRNCAFTGNAASGGGGGFHCDSRSEPVFEGCTFAGNRAAEGGALYVEGAAIGFDRVLIRGNGAASGPEIFHAAGSSLDFAGCVVDTGGVAGAGTIVWGGDCVAEDPLFCVPAAPAAAPTAEGNYHVDVASVCLSGTERIGAFGAGCRNGRVFEEEEEEGGHAVRPDGRERNASILGPSVPRFFVFPNPSRGGVTVEYACPASAPGRLSVYGVSGRLVRSYELNGPSGAVRWDGTGAGGTRVAPGVYFLRLVAGDEVETRRVTLIR